jgi:Transposase IS66 family
MDYDHVGGAGIVHAACWAHTRRKFFEAIKVNPKDQSSIRIAAQIEMSVKSSVLTRAFGPHVRRFRFAENS